jgi:tRNA-dihydrouridine synthase
LWKVGLLEIEECLEEVCCEICKPKEDKKYNKPEKQELEKKAEGILKLGELYINEAEKKIEEEKKPTHFRDHFKNLFQKKEEKNPPQNDFKHVNRLFEAVEHQQKEEISKKDKQEQNENNKDFVVTEQPQENNNNNNLKENGVGLDID